MTSLHRRSFLKKSGIALAPALLPSLSVYGDITGRHCAPEEKNSIQFLYDGPVFDKPSLYWEQLEQANQRQAIVPDVYGNGGAVAELQKKFASITGKEKAIYMPTGTMANQLAIHVLSGENSKIFVQEVSHIYRDEADAAQSVFNKRLIPLATDETYFTAEDLKNTISNLSKREAFNSGVGCVSIETPVRRRDGRMVPLAVIKEISAYCKEQKIGLHLDGARIYMASAWSGVSVKEYASYFDTVYISLYKYFCSSGGAILCGNSSVIDKMPHLIKTHGGNMFGNWFQAAMALHRLNGFEDRLIESIKRADIIFKAVESFGLKVSALDGGSNIYMGKCASGIDTKTLISELRADNIQLNRPNPTNEILMVVNETLLYREPAAIIDSFKRALGKSK